MGAGLSEENERLAYELLMQIKKTNRVIVPQNKQEILEIVDLLYAMEVVSEYTPHEGRYGGQILIDRIDFKEGVLPDGEIYFKNLGELYGFTKQDSDSDKL